MQVWPEKQAQEKSRFVIHQSQNIQSEEEKQNVKQQVEMKTNISEQK